MLQKMRACEKKNMKGRPSKKKIGKALVNNLPLIGNIFSWLLLQRYFVNFIE